jgi:sec-independent protein translocase protein TatA
LTTPEASTRAIGGRHLLRAGPGRPRAIADLHGQVDDAVQRAAGCAFRGANGEALDDGVGILAQAVVPAARLLVGGGAVRGGPRCRQCWPGALSAVGETAGPTGSVTCMNLGITELLIVLAILVVLFGAVKLPKLARSLGQSRNEFKRGLSDEPEPDDRVPPPD